MSRGNDVFQVLVPKSATVAPAGTPVASLALGQFGIFDYDTNLAVDGPVPNFYMAVGVDSTGEDATVNDIVKSSGTHIQSKNVVSLTGQCHVAAVDKVVSIKGFSVNCEEDYGIKLEIRNQEAYRLNGYNQVVKNYVVNSGDCVPCATDCPDGDCLAVVDALIALINADPDGVVTASKAGSTVTDGVCTDGITLTVNPAAFKRFCDINLNYFFPHQTDVIVTPLNISGTMTVDTDMVYEEGSGYDIKQLEYEAGGWNGKPGIYRVSELNGTAREGFMYFADGSKKYDMVHLSSDQHSISGFRGDMSFIRTIVATDNSVTGLSAAVTALISAVVPDMAIAEVDCFDVLP